MDKLLIAGVVVLALFATLVDFASRILSMAADGLLLAALVAAVIMLHRHHARRFGALRAERDDLALQLRDARRERGALQR